MFTEKKEVSTVIPTWKDVLFSQHTRWAAFKGDAQAIAKKIGYTHFSWNGRIYLTDSELDTGLFDRDIS